MDYSSLEYRIEVYKKASEECDEIISIWTDLLNGTNDEVFKEQCVLRIKQEKEEKELIEIIIKQMEE